MARRHAARRPMIAAPWTLIAWAIVLWLAAGLIGAVALAAAPLSTSATAASTGPLAFDPQTGWLSELKARPGERWVEVTVRWDRWLDYDPKLPHQGPAVIDMQPKLSRNVPAWARAPARAAAADGAWIVRVTAVGAPLPWLRSWEVVKLPGPTTHRFASSEFTLGGSPLTVPLSVVWMGLLANVLILGAPIGLAPAGWALIRGPLRRCRCRCPSCGYSRAGLATEAACPECGAKA
jgi:hypothetical protein